MGLLRTYYDDNCQVDEFGLCPADYDAMDEQGDISDAVASLSVIGDDFSSLLEIATSATNRISNLFYSLGSQKMTPKSAGCLAEKLESL